MRTWAMALLALVMGGAVAANELADDEKKAGFVALFSGKDFDGWEQKGNWKIEDGAIARKDKGGSLVYKKTKVPDDFEIRFDWKVGKGSNSGLYYRPGQYEYQILDNKVHGDGRNPRTSAASLYFCMAPAKDATRPVGEWNQGKIVCQGSIVQHWLNGERVLDFDYKSPKWAKEVELLRIRGADLAARGAYLSLQDHGDPVWYRHMRMRTIPASEKIDHRETTPMTIPAEALERERAFVANALKKKAQ